MKRYTELTKDEKLALDSGGFTDAVQIEAAKTGVPLPLGLEERTKQFRLTAVARQAKDAVTLYEIYTKSRYNEVATGIAFFGEKDARNALNGCVILSHESYPERVSLADAKQTNFSVRRVELGAEKSSTVYPIEEEARDLTAYEALVEACSLDLRDIKQAAYNAEVRAAKKEKYLTLAKGDETIAKSFWAATEGSAPWED